MSTHYDKIVTYNAKKEQIQMHELSNYSVVYRYNDIN
jgi:hypothetical protein